MSSDREAVSLKPPFKPPSNVLGIDRHPLENFFSPRTVAVVGATEKVGSVGRTILWNLITNPFGGTVFPVNPKRSSILGIKAYPSLKDVPETVDLAVVVTPAGAAPDVIKEGVEAGITSTVVISAGFKEIGPVGVELERRILEEAAKGGMRVIGPNCLGVMSPISGLNATFASSMARSGSVGFISQSGALCTAVLDWSHKMSVGFSAFVSIGSMVDVDWGDLIGYLGQDARTRSIVLYMESIGDARSFLSAAREVALTKPIIVIKAGKTQAAAKAAASHTGALAGSDEVLDAAFRRSGVLRVKTIAELFYMAEVLAKQPRPKGPRLTILTNAGGPGVLACDSLISHGGELTAISDEAMAAYNELLPPHWSHNNPVDILGDAEPERYARALDIAARDANADGMLVILTPQAMTDPTQTAEALKAHARQYTKPVLASWMGGADVAAGESILNKAGIPTFSYPDTAAKTFSYMWRYSDNLRGLYETPALPEDIEGIPDRDAAARIIGHAHSTGRTLLAEHESKQLLAAYGIPTVPTRIAVAIDEAVLHADSLGYPVVLKLYSETITHKTDVGGVHLNLRDADAVCRAWQSIKASVTEKAGAQHFLGVTVQPMVQFEGYELIVGCSLDAQFGPVLLVGAGGQLVEVFKDRSLALPPLTTTLARRMLERTQIYSALKGVRGRAPVDLAALDELLVRFSQLVVEQRYIKEIDINPLKVSAEQFVALDARVVLHGADVKPEALPRLAIRPYPRRYVREATLKSGAAVTIRPIRPEDEPLMVTFHEGLSERSVYLRYFHLLKLGSRVTHERLTRICFIDYDREMALVAEIRDPQTGEREIIGVARLHKIHGTNDGEFSILVIDRYQRQRLGSELMRQLIEIARGEGLSRLRADVLTENTDMQRMCEKLGIIIRRTDDPQLVAAEMWL
ncbi:MAG: bifunctional acetate--CoA ligase family protein/GNAT family N-acetyltransferase [Acidobacteria bacterium]|nr:bifunctional acetate--CoA ligase family protein/GNAT family N-acetyltransferase [Acidobacteriota bacterium]